MEVTIESHRRMNACQSPKTVYPAPILLAESSSGRAITRWIGCLCRSSRTWCAMWSAAAMLPQQPCSRSGACHAVDHAGRGDAGCARYDHRVVQEWANSWQTFFEIGSSHSGDSTALLTDPKRELNHGFSRIKSNKGHESFACRRRLGLLLIIIRLAASFSPFKIYAAI